MKDGQIEGRGEMKVTHLYPVQHGSTPTSKIEVPGPVVSGRNAEKEGQEGNVEEGRKEEGLGDWQPKG